MSTSRVETDPSRLLVLCRNRTAAIRFRDAVLPELAGGFDALPITTLHGLAHDLVARGSAGPPAPRSGTARPCGSCSTARARPNGRRCIPCSAAPRSSTRSPRPCSRTRPRSSTLQTEDADRWRELAAFTTRYLDVLDGRGCVDASGLLVRHCSRRPRRTASTTCWSTTTRPAHPSRPHLLDRLAGDPRSVCLTGADVEPPDIELDTASGTSTGRPSWFGAATPRSSPRRSQASCSPRADGVDWAQMAVLLRRPSDRGAAVARALARHRIPVAPVPGLVTDEPVVRAIIDMLRWVNGEAGALERLLVSPLAGLDATQVRDLRRRARGDDVAAMAATSRPSPSWPRSSRCATTWRREPIRRSRRPRLRGLAARATHLVAGNGTGSPGDDRALDALVAFLDGLRRHTERNPGDRLPQYIALLDGSPSSPIRGGSAGGRGPTR